MEMEFEPGLPGGGVKDPKFQSLKKNFRAKTVRRLEYEARTAVLRRDLGGLEEVRRKLGFSRRQICDFLCVDPSAWSRWLKDEGKVPPYVYRMLSLGLEVQIPREERLQTIKLSVDQLNRTQSAFETKILDINEKIFRVMWLLVGAAGVWLAYFLFKK